MSLLRRDMDQRMAKTILNWQYEKPYDLYNSTLTKEELEEMLNGTYTALVDEKESLIGFFCIGESATVPAGHKAGVYGDGFVDFGLGMRPEWTGKGNGSGFISFVLDHIEEKYGEMPIRLSVATFNQRAIHLYEKFGFRKEEEFQTAYTTFITMVRKAI